MPVTAWPSLGHYILVMIFLLSAKLDQYQCLIKYIILLFDLCFLYSLIAGDATWRHGILVTIGTGLKTVLQITTSIITVEPSPKIFRSIHPRTTSQEVLKYRPFQWIQIHYRISNVTSLRRQSHCHWLYTGGDGIKFVRSRHGLDSK